jgi:hypothetical protein
MLLTLAALTNTCVHVQSESDSKLLSGFPFIGHGNSDNNLESSCIGLHTDLHTCTLNLLSRIIVLLHQLQTCDWVSSSVINKTLDIGHHWCHALLHPEGLTSTTLTYLYWLAYVVPQSDSTYYSHIKDIFSCTYFVGTIISYVCIRTRDSIIIYRSL